MVKLNMHDFDDAYHIFEISFPKEELRPYNKMKNLFLSNKLSFYGIKINNILVSAIIVWEFSEFIFLENFATLPMFRKKGIGKSLLDEICAYFNKPIILEAENPYDEISKRRIQYYQRNGFVLTDFGYKQPPFYDTGETYFLKILSYKNNLNENIFSQMKEIVFKEVYEKSLV